MGWWVEKKKKIFHDSETSSRVLTVNASTVTLLPSVGTFLKGRVFGLPETNNLSMRVLLRLCPSVRAFLSVNARTVALLPSVGTSSGRVLSLPGTIICLRRTLLFQVCVREF